ncbi:MAG TPA: S-layer homology domain-containing protein [Firmicutes bacterium]|nr:S-layer homology domain-containing protein [Bacillota bacterium]
MGGVLVGYRRGKLVGLIALVLIMWGSVAGVGLAAQEAGLRFGDVPGWHWAGEYIYGLAARGVISGIGQGRFAPEKQVSRAEFAKMVVYAIGKGEAATGGGQTKRFSDVKPEDWFAPFVEVVQSRGIMVGSDGMFRPVDGVTRVEAAVVLARLFGGGVAAGAGIGEFADAGDIPEWARSAVVVARACGVIKGYPDGTFKPFDKVTRAEAAAMVARYMDAVGLLYDAIGTVEMADGPAGKVLVKSPVGLAALPASEVWAEGLQGGGVRRLDQVGIIFGADGSVKFCAVVTPVDGGMIAWVEAGSGRFGYVSRGDGKLKSVVLSSECSIYRQGRRCNLSDLQEGDTAYVVLDRTSGRAMVVDARRANFAGKVLAVEGSGKLRVEAMDGRELRQFSVPEGAVIYVDGGKAKLGDLNPGDKVLIWEQAGIAEYIEALRSEAGI